MQSFPSNLLQGYKKVRVKCTDLSKEAICLQFITQGHGVAFHFSLQSHMCAMCYMHRVLECFVVAKKILLLRTMMHHVRSTENSWSCIDIF